MPITIDIQNIGGAIIFAAAITAALGVLWRQWGKPTQQWFRDLERTVKVVEEQLKINGDEHLLPHELQHLPLRSLVIKHIVETGPLIKTFVEEHREQT